MTRRLDERAQRARSHAIRWRSAAAFLVVGLSLFSCKRRTDIDRIVKKDEGALCLGLLSHDAGVQPTTEIAANETIAVTVKTACLSDKCATDRTKICTAKREGARIVIASEMAWVAPTEIGQPCPGTCSPIEAHCTIEALPAGKYTLVHGARSMDLEVPSTLPWTCGVGNAHTPVAGPRGDAGIVALPVRSVTPPPQPTAVPTTPTPGVDPAVPATGAPPVAKPPGDAVCITAFGGKTPGFKAGQAAAVRISRPNPCTGLACSAGKPKCTAKRKGKTVTVVADIPAPGQKPRAPCTEDCAPLVATCRTDALAAGTYTFEIGARKETVTVPSTSAAVCDE